MLFRSVKSEYINPNPLHIYSKTQVPLLALAPLPLYFNSFVQPNSRSHKTLVSQKKKKMASAELEKKLEGEEVAKSDGAAASGGDA